MKRPILFAAIAGLLLPVVGLGMRNSGPAWAATLDGFAINTQDKAVTVTLYTDQRVPYTTENQGRQFTITLPDTQISPEQMTNGLPVVIDNKNLFIGRALPAGDGKVKIVLPNLPANEYAVSIQQKRPGQGNENATLLKPRSALQNSAETGFEQIASRYTAQQSNTTGGSKKPSRNGLRLAPVAMNGMRTADGSVWNPYVVKAPATPYSHYRPVTRKPAERKTPAVSEPVNTVSMAEPRTNSPDPLWYLHSLPPMAPSVNPTPAAPGEMIGPAVSNTGLLAQAANPVVLPQAQPAAITLDLGKQVKAIFKALPPWVVITSVLFLGGIGIFALIGGLVLLKLLLTQVKQDGLTGAMPAQAPLNAASEPVQNRTTSRKPYAARPKASSRVSFQDTASVNAMDYLKEAPSNMSQAVQRSTLVKFPYGRRINASHQAVGLRS